MELKKGNVVFVRFDYKACDKEVPQDVLMACMAYLEGFAGERQFSAGVYGNEDGAMLIFEAADLEEAQKISDNDPIIKGGYYNYKLYEWHLMITS